MQAALSVHGTVLGGVGEATRNRVPDSLTGCWATSPRGCSGALQTLCRIPCSQCSG
jgi:hypothetical protein